MALSEFDIATGGLTSIPVLGGLIFLGYKSFGEMSLDTSKLKPKKRPAVTEITPTTDKKTSIVNSQKTEKNINTASTSKEKTSAGEQLKSVNDDTSISSKNQPEEKISSNAAESNNQTGKVDVVQ